MSKQSNLVNNSQDITVDASGNVGIGNAAPTTALDVTGIITSDGLTVDRENLSDLKSWTNSDVGSIDFYQAASYPAANQYGRVLDINSGSSNSVGGSSIRLLTAEGNDAGKQRLTISNNGDLSLYEDTGTTPKFFWDSSAESLGIGTSSTLGKVTVANAAGANAPTTVTAANTYLQLGSDEYGASNNGKFMIGFGYTDGTNTNSPAYIGYEEASTSGDTYGDLTFYTRSVTTDTAPTERMRIDSAGRVTMPYQPAFVAYRQAVGDVTYAAGVNVSADMTSTQFNIGNNYSTSTGRFTAPVAGRYFFYCAMYNGSGTSGRRMKLSLNSGGSLAWGQGAEAALGAFNASGIINMAAGDYVFLQTAYADTTIFHDIQHSIFGGYLLG